MTAAWLLLIDRTILLGIKEVMILLEDGMVV